LTYLLDINLLIALCDPEHDHHEMAHRWFGSLASNRWATCAITENGFIRITGHSTYLNWKRTPAEQVGMLRRFCSLANHEFWTDDVSLLDTRIWTSAERIRSADVTDLYLLALAVKNRGKFASLDRGIPQGAIKGGQEALFVISK
jgi:toxin-antitoxin system PIN domain toxin